MRPASRASINDRNLPVAAIAPLRTVRQIPTLRLPGEQPDGTVGRGQRTMAQPASGRALSKSEANEAYQFLLGMMAAYAPCLIFMAFMLRDIGTGEPEPLRVKTSDAYGRLHASRQAGSIH